MGGIKKDEVAKREQFRKKIMDNLDEITRLIGEYAMPYRDIAQRIGVSAMSMSYERVNNKALQEAIAEGWNIYDSKVEEALGKRALGYDTYEEKVVEKIDKNGEVSTEVVRTKKHIPADIGAMAIYLKRRHKMGDAQEMLKFTQIEKIKQEIEIMKQTGEMPVDRKVNELMTRLGEVVIGDGEHTK